MPFSNTFSFFETGVGIGSDWNERGEKDSTSIIAQVMKLFYESSQ